MEQTERLFHRVSGVEALWTTIAAATGDLLEEEAQAVSDAVPKRVREFSAGRRLARHVLGEIGVDAAAIPAGPDRLPVWPAEFNGSISHTAERVAVAICRRNRYLGIGLDIEAAGSLDRGLVESVLTIDEDRKYLQDAIDPTILFSCKEAVYKAVYPRFREFLEFHDVEIDLRGADFLANCRPEKASAAWIVNGRGTIYQTADHIVTMFLI